MSAPPASSTTGSLAFLQDCHFSQGRNQVFMGYRANDYVSPNATRGIGTKADASGTNAVGIYVTPKEVRAPPGKGLGDGDLAIVASNFKWYTEMDGFPRHHSLLRRPRSTVIRTSKDKDVIQRADSGIVAAIAVDSLLLISRSQDQPRVSADSEQVDIGFYGVVTPIRRTGDEVLPRGRQSCCASRY